MKSIPLLKEGIAFIPVHVATLDGTKMPILGFCVDTGATRTTVRKSILIDELGYTDDYINKNKVILPEKERPVMANGKRADVYKVKITRMGIDGYEFQHDYILTSDSIKTLGLLFGLDMLCKFKFTFDFDAIDEDAPYGKMFYEFRKSQLKAFTKLGEPFAYQLNTSQ